MNSELPLEGIREAVLLTANGKQTASSEVLEKILGTNDKQLRDLASRHVIPKPVNSQYELDATITGYVAWLRKRAEKSNALPIFASMKSASARTGIPLQLIEAAKANGCPAFDAAGRVALEKLLAWIFAQSPDGQFEKDWSAVYERARAQIEELKLEQMRNAVLPREVATEAGHHLMQIFFRALDRQETEFAQTLAGADAAKIKIAVGHYNDAVRESIRSSLQSLENSANSEADALRAEAETTEQ